MANMVNPHIIILGLVSAWIILFWIFLSRLIPWLWFVDAILLCIFECVHPRVKCIESPMWFLLHISHNNLMCCRSSKWSLPHTSTLTHIYEPFPPLLYLFLSSALLTSCFRNQLIYFSIIALLSLMAYFDLEKLHFVYHQTFFWLKTCNGVAAYLKNLPMNTLQLRSNSNALDVGD